MNFVFARSEKCPSPRVHLPRNTEILKQQLAKSMEYNAFNYKLILSFSQADAVWRGKAEKSESIVTLAFSTVHQHSCAGCFRRRPSSTHRASCQMPLVGAVPNTGGHTARPPLLRQSGHISRVILPKTMLAYTKSGIRYVQYICVEERVALLSNSHAFADSDFC